jgi:ribonuclease HII
VLPDGFPFVVLNDSQKLKPKQRDDARLVIIDKALAWAVAWASHTEIDAINILQASLLAMQRAFNFLIKAGLENRAFLKTAASFADGAWPLNLETETPFGRPFFYLQQPADLSAIVDGLYVPELPIPCTALVKADNSVHEVMAASILAKTARDQLMTFYGSLYPEYGYDRHKGYPTREHRELVIKHGPSPIQRISFKVMI